MTGAAEHPAGRRGIRRLVGAGLLVVALAVLLVAVQTLWSHGLALTSRPTREPATLSPLPTSTLGVATPAAPMKPPAEPGVVPGPSATPGPHPRPDAVIVHRGDNASIDSGDWRDRVAAQMGRKAVEHLPLEAGAMHRHTGDGVAGSGASIMMPMAAPPAAAAPGVAELQGWDGGPFWFGPNGLVRMTGEAQR